MFESENGIQSFDSKNSRFSSIGSFDEAIPSLKSWVSPNNIDKLSNCRFCKVHHFDVLESTNQYLLTAARQGAKQGLVGWADEQTQGRGRKARLWLAPKGAALLVSLLFRPPNLQIPLFWFSALVADAAAKACEKCYGISPQFKWPNDLVINSLKLGGILTEIDWNGSVPAIIVGMGLNLNLDDDSLKTFPVKLRSKIISIRQLNGMENGIGAFLEEFLLIIDQKYSDLLTTSKVSSLQSDYRNNCSTLGTRVRVQMDDGEVFEGVACDIDHEGQLLVEVGMCLRTINSGEVFHLR